LKEAIAYYNKDADNFYIKIKNAKVEHTISWDEGRFYIDFDKNNQAVGIEIVGFAKGIPLGIPKKEIIKMLTEIKEAKISVNTSNTSIYFKYYLKFAKSSHTGETAIPISAAIRI